METDSEATVWVENVIENAFWNNAKKEGNGKQC